MEKRKKLLVIAGGGVFGCIPQHFLAGLPRELQHLRGVDLLSGCSIGGILAVQYQAGVGFPQVDRLFIDDASKCFTKRWQACINPLASPTYRSDTIEAVIRQMLGKIKLGDVRGWWPKLDLIIPTLNLTDDSYKVFDNIRHDDDDIELTELALITSAAPTYYAGREYKGKCYVDGGLIEVAPLLTSATALKHKRGIPFCDMDVLMIGTGVEQKDHKISTAEYNGYNLLQVATKVIVPYVTQSNEMATRFWGQQMGFNSFVYWNPCKTVGGLDDVSAIPESIKQCDALQDDFNEAWNKWLEA